MSAKAIIGTETVIAFFKRYDKWYIDRVSKVL